MGNLVLVKGNDNTYRSLIHPWLICLTKQLNSLYTLTTQFTQMYMDLIQQRYLEDLKMAFTLVKMGM